jgi:hypothetical protein
MGDTKIRFQNVTSRRRSGEKRLVMPALYPLSERATTTIYLHALNRPGRGYAKEKLGV